MPPIRITGYRRYGATAGVGEMESGVLDAAVKIMAARAASAVIAQPQLPTGFVPLLPVEEGPIYIPDREVRDVMGCAFAMTYIDSSGEVSRRRITVRYVSADGDTLYLGSFCHERQAFRSFRVDRIQELIALDTGEVISDASAWINAVLDSDPTGAAIMRSRHPISILTMLARCDGSFHQDEKDIIVDYVMDIGGYRQGIDEKVIASYVGAMFPDEKCFSRSLRYLKKWDALKVRKMMLCLRRVVDSDGVISSEESRFLDQMHALVG